MLALFFFVRARRLSHSLWAFLSKFFFHYGFLSLAGVLGLVSEWVLVGWFGGLVWVGLVGVEGWIGD